MEKPLQIFTDEYLEGCKDLTPNQIVEFLENFRLIADAGRKKKSRLISIKVPQDLLEAFKFKSRLEGKAYQSVIKELMVLWLHPTAFEKRLTR